MEDKPNPIAETQIKEWEKKHGQLPQITIIEDDSDNKWTVTFFDAKFLYLKNLKTAKLVKYYEIAKQISLQK